MSFKITKTRLSLISIIIILTSFFLSQDWSLNHKETPVAPPALPTPSTTPTPTAGTDDIKIPVATDSSNLILPKGF